MDQAMLVAHVHGATSIPVPQGVTSIPVPQGVTSILVPQGVTSIPVPQGVTFIPVPQCATSILVPQRVTSSFRTHPGRTIIYTLEPSSLDCWSFGQEIVWTQFPFLAFVDLAFVNISTL